MNEHLRTCKFDASRITEEIQSTWKNDCITSNITDSVFENAPFNLNAGVSARCFEKYGNIKKARTQKTKDEKKISENGMFSDLDELMIEPGLSKRHSTSSAVKLKQISILDVIKSE